MKLALATVAHVEDLPFVKKGGEIINCNLLCQNHAYDLINLKNDPFLPFYLFLCFSSPQEGLHGHQILQCDERH